MNKQMMQEQLDEWTRIEEALGGRFSEGKECPLYVVELFQLAEATAHGSPLESRLTGLREHLKKCPFCLNTYESALVAARADCAGQGAEKTFESVFLQHAPD